MKVKKKQKLAKKWFIKLQNIICKNVEHLEKEYGSNITFKKKITMSCAAIVRKPT